MNFKVGNIIIYKPIVEVDPGFKKSSGHKGVIVEIVKATRVKIRLYNPIKPIPFNPFNTNVKNIQLSKDTQLLFSFMYAKV